MEEGEFDVLANEAEAGTEDGDELNHGSLHRNHSSDEINAEYPSDDGVDLIRTVSAPTQQPTLPSSTTLDRGRSEALHHKHKKHRSHHREEKPFATPVEQEHPTSSPVNFDQQSTSNSNSSIMSKNSAKSNTTRKNLKQHHPKTEKKKPHGKNAITRLQHDEFNWDPVVRQDLFARMLERFNNQPNTLEDFSLFLEVEKHRGDQWQVFKQTPGLMVDKAKVKYLLVSSSLLPSIITHNPCVLTTRQVPNCEPELVRVVARVPNVSCKDVFRLVTDMNVRVQWDKNYLEVKVLDKDPLGLSDLLYMSTFAPFPLSGRDYVQYRGLLFDPEKSTHLCIYRNTKRLVRWVL